jgi:hypothetical protein
MKCFDCLDSGQVAIPGSYFRGEPVYMTCKCMKDKMFENMFKAAEFKTYLYNEPIFEGDKILDNMVIEKTEQQILDEYWDYWKAQMDKKYGENHEFTTKENCIIDYTIVNWAWEKNDMDIEKIARVCHEANRGWCEANNDFSQPVWDEAEEWQKTSAINGVQFHLDNPDTTPEQSHINWLKEKIETGWEYGEEKDPEKKKHPCMLPYSQLPKMQRVKDAIFTNIIKAFSETKSS